jgi:hypothetical protein
VSRPISAGFSGFCGGQVAGVKVLIVRTSFGGEAGRPARGFVRGGKRGARSGPAEHEHAQLVTAPVRAGVLRT